MKIKVVNKSKHPLPHYATTQSAGMDLRANLDEPIILKPLDRTLVKTGIFMELLWVMKRKLGQGADWHLKKE